MVDSKTFGMEEPAMNDAEKEAALNDLAQYLANSPDEKINTEAFCKACEIFKYDPFAFNEDDLNKLEGMINQLLTEAAEARKSDWVEIDDVALNRLAMYLLSFTDGNISTEVLYTACMACKLDPHGLTEAHMASLEMKLNELDAELNGGGQAANDNDAVLDQVAKYLVEDTDGDITTDVLFGACNQFGLDPLMLSERDMDELQRKINAYAGVEGQVESNVIDDAALDRLAKTIMGSPVQEINVEVLYNACRTCGINPHALDDHAMMMLQIKLNALSK